MATTLRLIDNFMSDAVRLQADDEDLRVEPHGREWTNISIPVCEDESAFHSRRLELRVLALDQTIRLWEAGGHIRYSGEGVWSEEAEKVPGTADVDRGLGIVVGAMGGFRFKRVNV